MIRVAILDRHPAVRAGLHALLRSVPGLASRGPPRDRRELLPLLYRTDPDVLRARRARARPPREDRGAADARGALRRRARAPSCCSRPRSRASTACSTRARPTFELLACALRAAGEPALPAVGPQAQARAAARLDPRDRPIFAMRLAGTSAARHRGCGRARPWPRSTRRIQAIVTQLVPAASRRVRISSSSVRPSLDPRRPCARGRSRRPRRRAGRASLPIDDRGVERAEAVLGGPRRARVAQRLRVAAAARLGLRPTSRSGRRRPATRRPAHERQPQPAVVVVDDHERALLARPRPTAAPRAPTSSPGCAASDS